MKIMLLGSFAGNNAGDMVILESVINDFNHLLLGKVPKKENSIFGGIEHLTGIELVIPTLDEKGLEFIEHVVDIAEGMIIRPIPINRNCADVARAAAQLIKRFSEADYIYTTAGILFDQKIWNPFYNFVTVYTPLLLWAKFKNPNVKIIGYNIGITSSGKTIGKYLLKKCVRLHDRIYLRNKTDAVLLERFRYKGGVFFSADNVFGYGKPQMSPKQQCNKLYINLTLYGVNNRKTFVQEITAFVCRIKNEYEVCFFQTSKRDLEIAREVCEKAHLKKECIYYLSLMGYQKIEDLLSECDILIGMRMHSLIFALKGGCPVIAMGYSSKVVSLMQDMHLENFLIDMASVSENALLSKVAAISEQKEELLQQMYEELEKRYFFCNRYK